MTKKDKNNEIKGNKKFSEKHEINLVCLKMMKTEVQKAEYVLSKES